MEIITSGDPNDKVGNPGAGTVRYLSGTPPLSYSIYFDNMPTVTAPAQKIVIRDELNASILDLPTVTLGPVSFVDKLVTPPAVPLSVLGTFSTEVDLRPTKSLIVRITAALNQSTGLLTWTYTSLDPVTLNPTDDPLVGLLPPGTEGSVSFSVIPKTAATNTQITNKATIVFDTNPPMDTPVWSNTLDNTAPTSKINPLSATVTLPSFPVQWAGSDVGAGIATYDVYASDDGGAVTLWQDHTASTSAMFSGQVGHTYRFYSIARDLVGNIEPSKNIFEAITTVVPAATCASNITNQFTITPGGLRRNNATGRWLQTLTITKSTVNVQPTSGPFALALDSLSKNASVYGSTTATSCAGPAGSPLVELNPGAPWNAGKSLTVNLEFVNPTNVGISYTPRVLGGSANR